MQKNTWIMFLTFGILFSCSKKMYVKEDYHLFNKDFQLQPNQLLRTDGVYVLQTIWNNKTGERKANEHHFYKFYNKGQSNLTVDLNHEIKSDASYLNSIKEQIASTKQGEFKTHFEGYYNLKNNRIVIERISVPRKISTYNYGYLEEGKLIIVKETIEGSGKIEDNYFTDYYKATYVFKPLDNSILENLQPGW
jgi:hypothetical protein